MSSSPCNEKLSQEQRRRIKKVVEMMSVSVQTNFSKSEGKN